MDKIIFHHAPMSRSNIVHWMLEELGVPYELDAMSLERGDHKKPAYLAINAMGKVPAITHQGITITEAAAICAYLADEFPAAKLSVPIGDPRRGVYLKWLFFGPSCLEQAIIDRIHNRPLAPPQASSYGDHDTVMETLAQAVAKGPYLVGGQFTAADVVIGSGVQWGTMMKAVPERPEFASYMERLRARPAAQRSFAKNQALYEQLHPKAAG
ncbi:glutathione S-transferase family protein [Dongia deserti]|uniref:glutathione S-transferase family protein n=1 Tax=Dongia deserti TaxID=2268030 RepID=UPI002547A427|nr:glutathione S-transferase [Dongia deserti]